MANRYLWPFNEAYRRTIFPYAFPQIFTFCPFPNRRPVFPPFLPPPFSSQTFAQKEIQLKSPNGNITFSFNLTRDVPTYKVTYKGTELIGESTLGLDFKEGGTFGEKLRMGTPTYWNAEENYDLVVGKVKYVFSYSKAISIPLMERSGAGRQVDLVVRVFNEGVAFRYEFPPQASWASYEMTEERSTFNIKGNPKVRAMLLGTYTSSHEAYYRKMPLSEVKNDTLMDMPALFEFPNNVYMAITEANLRNYAGMYLRKKEGYLTTQLSPLPGQKRNQSQSDAAA